MRTPLLDDSFPIEQYSALRSFQDLGRITPMTTNKTFKAVALTIIWASLLLLPLLLVSPAKAYGYADPGTGAFVYQAAYAAFLGGTFYLRRFLNHVFRRRK